MTSLSLNTAHSFDFYSEWHGCMQESKFLHWKITCRILKEETQKRLKPFYHFTDTAMLQQSRCLHCLSTRFANCLAILPLSPIFRENRTNSNICEWRDQVLAPCYKTLPLLLPSHPCQECKQPCSVKKPRARSCPFLLQIFSNSPSAQISGFLGSVGRSALDPAQ